jgi:hypothetical protein
MKKRYIVRKYVMAQSAADAIKQERKRSPDDVWIDEEWMKNNPQAESRPIGFNTKRK